MRHDPAELQPFLDELSLSGPLDPFLVFADWLQARGDRWGELIAMQCQPPVDRHSAPLRGAARPGDAGACDPLKKRLLELTGFRLLDELADELCPHDPIVGIAWQRGFVSTLAFSDTRDPTWLGEELARLFALPAVALCNEVSFAGGYLDDDDVRGLLRHRERLRRLDRLDLEGNWFSPAVVAELRHAFPRARLDNQRGDDEERPDRGVLIRSWDEREDD